MSNSKNAKKALVSMFTAASILCAAVSAKADEDPFASDQAISLRDNLSKILTQIDREIASGQTGIVREMPKCVGAEAEGNLVIEIRKEDGLPFSMTTETLTNNPLIALMVPGKVFTQPITRPASGEPKIDEKLMYAAGDLLNRDAYKILRRLITKCRSLEPSHEL